jgi:hypothetical protein
MATTSRAALRQRVQELVGTYDSLSASSNGASGGTTIVDTELASFTATDDGIQGWVLITSGSALGETRRILPSGGYTASSTTLTFNFGFSAQIASAVTYEIYPYNPTDYHQAIIQASRQLTGSEHLYLAIRDETLVVDQQLSNGDFEDFT